MTLDHFGHGEHGEDRESYWAQWLQPPTVITLIVAAVTIYGSQVIQAERLETMRAKVEAIERDYSRRELVALELRNIDARLQAIEVKLGAGDRR